MTVTLFFSCTYNSLSKKVEVLKVTDTNPAECDQHRGEFPVSVYTTSFHFMPCLVSSRSCRQACTAPGKLSTLSLLFWRQMLCCRQTGPVFFASDCVVLMEPERSLHLTFHFFFLSLFPPPPSTYHAQPREELSRTLGWEQWSASLPSTTWDSVGRAPPCPSLWPSRSSGRVFLRYWLI